MESRNYSMCSFASKRILLIFNSSFPILSSSTVLFNASNNTRALRISDSALFGSYTFN